MTYLDDDDYFTKGYLMELVGYIAEGVDVVCGRTVDLLPDGTLNEDNYILKALRKFGGRVYDEPWPLTPFFSSVCMKLYRHHTAAERLGRLRRSQTLYGRCCVLG